MLTIDILFFQCRDTYYIESFHNVILVYAPKIYNTRINIAILDWVCIFLCTICGPQGYFWNLILFSLISYLFLMYCLN